MSVETNLNVFTLNCWGIPMISKHRMQRMKAIATELALGKYDLVCLQEVWSEIDYKNIKDVTSQVLPYSHYFYSGVVGSGICIFSKFPIEDVFFHQWPINGYIHKIQHGDWFGGKGVGLCRLTYNSIRINIYTTHLHAEYNRESDEYKAHRATQAFELSQFMRLTSGSADLVILAGDLNTEPGDLAHQIIIHNTNLVDAFRLSPTMNCGQPYTNNSPTNSYCPLNSQCVEDHAKRIDYILFRTGHEIQVDVASYKHPLPDRVSGQEFSYSDHEAILTTLKIAKLMNSPESDNDSRDLDARTKSLQEGIAVCNEALSKLRWHKHAYNFFSAILVMLLGMTIGQDPFWGPALDNLVRIFFTVTLCFTVMMATLWNRSEVNGILAGKLGMENVLRQLGNLPTGGIEGNPSFSLK